MSNFSDPEWWPRRPLPAPKRLSLGAVLLGCMVPLVVATAIVLLVVSRRHSHSPTGRTIASYTECLLAHGDGGPAATGGPRADADCEALKPSGLSPAGGGVGGQQQQPASAQARFRTCVEQALAASGASHEGSAHGGRGPGGSPSAFHAAELVCASIAAGASGLPSRPHATSTTSLKL